MLPPNSGLNCARQRQYISQNRWYRRQATRCLIQSHNATVGRQVCVGFGPFFGHVIGLYLYPRFVLLIVFGRLLDMTGLSFVLWLPLTVLLHVKCLLSVQAFCSASCINLVMFCYACLLAAWSIVLEKLAVSQLVIFPAFYRTRRFITAFTSAHHLCLSWASSIQSVSPHPNSWRSILNIIVPSTPGSSEWSPSLTFSHQNPVYTFPRSHTCYMPHPSHSSQFNHPNNIGWGVQIIKLLIM